MDGSDTHASDGTTTDVRTAHAVPLCVMHMSNAHRGVWLAHWAHVLLCVSGQQVWRHIVGVPGALGGARDIPPVQWRLTGGEFGEGM